MTRWAAEAATRLGGVLVDEAGGGRAGDHLGAFDEGAQQGDVGLHPIGAEVAQGAVGAQHGLGEGGGMADDLGQQGVVVGAGDVAGVAIAVDAHAGAGRRLVGDEASAGGLRFLGGEGLQIDPGLDGEAARGRRGGEADVGQAVAGGQADLGLDEVDAGDLLGDGVLHLQAGVGLDEGELAALRIQQELDGAQGAVADGGGDADGGLVEASPGPGR